ncbi:MAG TPA: PAS domain S-box protein [Bacillota bacterium]|nr:PAS domain S-box protein [Bacillota bacterium]
MLTNDPASQADPSRLLEGHPPLQSFLGVPLVQGDKILGMIGLGNRVGGYQEQDLKTLEALAHTIVQVFKYKRAEQALRKSEERLLLAQQAARCGTWEFDFSRRNFFWAPGFLEATQVIPGKSESLDINIASQYIHSDDQNPLLRNLMERISRHETEWSFEHRDQRPSSGFIWVESRGKITYDEKTGKPIRMMGISIDITERKQMVEALHETAQKAEQHANELEAIISSIAAGVIIYDTAGNIIHISEYAQKKLGYSAADYQIPHQERRARLKMCKWDGVPYTDEDAPLYRALGGEIIRDEEILILKKPDQPLWISATFTPLFDSNQQPTGVVFTFTDITTLKRRAEKSLASERELLKVTLNSLGEGVVATDRQDRIILFNQAAATLTGYSQSEAIGKTFPEILNVCDYYINERTITSASLGKSGKPSLVTRDLRELPVSINSSPIKTPEGLTIGRVIVFSDITAKLKTEQELLRTQKLESLGILAGGIAHDFNNLLGAILANIQLAMIKLEKNLDFKPCLLNTIETTRKASDLTKQLLTFSKGGAPVKKDASLIDLIQETAEFVLQGAVTKAEFDIPNNLWPVNADVGQISQVIHNLIINANQAMPKGGIIHVKAENIAIEEKTHLAPGKYVKITIADQGIGITKENLSKIFDPFFTTKRDGNGLGLATSYSIITRHNGYIEVESLEGAGASFYIYLPAANPSAPLTELPPEDFGSGEGLNILIMDDEKKILHAVGEMLRYYGYRIALACDGSTAIKTYREALMAGTRFDAVVMDLTVPGGMGGLETITHLRELDPNIKAIVSSGYANDPIMADYKRYGFVGMVSKPYKIAELHEVLQRVIHLV